MDVVRKGLTVEVVGTVEELQDLLAGRSDDVTERGMPMEFPDDAVVQATLYFPAR